MAAEHEVLMAAALLAPSWSEPAGPLLLDGDAEPALREIGRAATASGTGWIDVDLAAASDAPDEAAAPGGAFRLWRALARSHPAGARLVERVAKAPPGVVDPDSPILRDPLGVSHEVERWISASIPERSVIVLRGIETAGPDCARSVAYVARAFVSRRRRLVLVARQTLDQHWERICGRLAAEINLQSLVDAWGSSRAGAPAAPADAEDPAAAIELLRCGATAEGMERLARGLASPLVAGWSAAARYDALAHQGMALLRTRQHPLAVAFAQQAMRLAPGERERHRDRRVLMAALHNLGRAHELLALGRQALEQAQHPLLSPARRAWLTLDAALGCALVDAHQHRALLDRLLAGSTTEVPMQVLAVAHIWRAACEYVARGSLERVALHQAAGLRLIEQMQDVTRAVTVRARLAGTLVALGRLDEATPLLEITARQAIAAGQFEFGARTLTQTIATACIVGRSDLARELWRAASAMAPVLWGSPTGEEQRQYCRAQLALAEGELFKARTLARELLDHEEQDSGPAARSPTFLCEIVCLLAEIAAADGDGPTAEQWRKLGRELVDSASFEEQPRLAGLLARAGLGGRGGWRAGALAQARPRDETSV